MDISQLGDSGKDSKLVCSDSCSGHGSFDDGGTVGGGSGSNPRPPRIEEVSEVFLSETTDKVARRKEYDRWHYLKNRERRIQEAMAVKRANPQRVRDQANARLKRDGDRIRKQYRDNYQKNKVNHRKRVSAYLKSNRPKARAWQRKYKKGSIIAKINGACRARINAALHFKATPKFERTRVLIGCTARAFRDHLQSQFSPEMSWKNYGKYWVIDHISPVSKFDLTKPWQQRLAFHYSNCRPLEREKNKEKADRVLQLHELLDL